MPSVPCSTRSTTKNQAISASLSSVENIVISNTPPHTHHRGQIYYQLAVQLKDKGYMQYQYQYLFKWLRIGLIQYFFIPLYSKSTNMSQVRYTNNEHLYGAEQGYTVANPVLNGTGQYSTTYQNVYPVGQQQEVTYTNYAASNQPATTGYNYVVGAGTAGSTVRNTTVQHSIAAPPKITFGHPSGGYAQTNTSYYQSYVPPQQATTTTTYVTNPQTTTTTYVTNPQTTTIVSNPQPTQVLNTTVVKEFKETGLQQQGNVVKANPNVSTNSSYSAKTTNDDFLCGKCCWILTALIGLALLTLALLYGLGVFGGAGTPSVNGPTVAANLPSVNGGKVGVNAPSINGPNLSLNGPHVTAPSVDINGPKVNLPNVDVNGPHITAPSVNLNGGLAGIAGTTGVSTLPTGQIAPTIGSTTQYIPSTNNQVQVQPASISPQSVEPVTVAPVTFAPTNTAYSQPTVTTRPVSVQPTVQPTYNFQPTTVQPQAYSVQPTSVQPTSVQPTSFQPTSFQPTAVQPQPYSVQPTSVQPTSYTPTSTKTDPYYDQRYQNGKYVPAYPVQ